MAGPEQAGPAWRRDPYRLLFPLGLLLSWAGVLHWALHAGGVGDYRPVFHAVAQIQGFLTSFAAGFLLTAIPRRTGTRPPAAWEMAVALAAPAAATAAAWAERWVLSQACWLALAVMLVSFALRRFLSAQAARRPPNSFVWLPLALLMGIAGSLLTGALGLLGLAGAWLHDLGRLLLLQGLFLGLVLGVGGMVLPLITRGEPPPDAGSSRAGRLARLGHAAAAGALVLSFWIENSGSTRWGAALRAAVVLAVLLAAARIDRPPRVPGWHRRLAWISAWMVPAGYLAVSLWPLNRAAGLHVVFIGGFALMTLSVSLHVTLAHGGYPRLLVESPWQVAAYGGLLLAAVAARALVDFDAARFYAWLGISASLFLVATLAWASVVLPRLWRAGGE